MAARKGARGDLRQAGSATRFSHGERLHRPLPSGSGDTQRRVGLKSAPDRKAQRPLRRMSRIAARGVLQWRRNSARAIAAVGKSPERPANCDFDLIQFLHLRPMTAMRAATAAFRSVGEGLARAVLTSVGQASQRDSAPAPRSGRSPLCQMLRDA